MPNLEEIKEQISHLDGASKFLGRREIKELPNILWEGENIECIVQGLYNNKNGVLVSTNRRVVFVDKGLIYGLAVEDFPYDKISSFQYSTGLVFGKITIFASNNKAEIKQVTKELVKNFADHVQERISRQSAKNNAPEEGKTEAKSIPDQIRELAALKDEGILSEEEFEMKKTELMSKI